MTNIYDVINSPDAFTQQDCDRIMAMYSHRAFERALVQNNLEQKAIRSSDIQFVPPDDENQWVFQKLANAASYINDAVFKFELDQLREGFQFTMYGPDDHYGWHVDIGADERQKRKLSIVLQLNDGFTGGALEFFPSMFSPVAQKGMLTVFPSFIPHRVTPVITGTRHTLVAWVAGESAFA